MIFLRILLPIFLVIGGGAVFSRFFRPRLEPFIQFALYLAAPALVFNSVARGAAGAGELALILAFALLFTAAFWLLSETVGRLLRLDPLARRAFSLATVTMNVGYYGMPLVWFAFGPSSRELSVLLFVAFNLPMATWGIWMAAGGSSSPGEGMRETLKMPIFHALALALLFSLAGWEVPEPLMKGVGMLGEAAAPVMLVILGMQVERLTLVPAAGSLTAAALLRLLVSPLVAWPLASLLGFSGQELKVLVLQTSTPTAVLTLVYSLRYRCQPQWMASAILVTTLASALTLWGLLALML